MVTFIRILINDPEILFSNLKLMKPIICLLLLILTACTREIESYTTRLEIQNNLNSQINYVIYPKQGIILSCESSSTISQNGSFVAFYAVGAIKDPIQLFSSIVDSVQISYTNPPETILKYLLFKPNQVKNYTNNPFEDDKSWAISNTITDHYTASSNMHLRTCIFEIDRDSIISGK